jgi:hypothetical protein
LLMLWSRARKNRRNAKSSSSCTREADRAIDQLLDQTSTATECDWNVKVLQR